ncbi:MAG TPA: tetratricopeptide repeat protein [Sphingomicrobium sp.]
MALAAFPVSASASVISIGSGFAESCWRAAEDRDASRTAMDNCNKAMAEEGLGHHDRVATHVNRGILYLIRGNVKEANTDFDTALRLDPTEPDAWLNKAVIHARFGNSTAAMPFVSKALELKTRRPALAYFVRAMAYEDSGNIQAAYYDLKRAQSLEPKWSEPVAELKRFQVRRP